MDAFAAAAGMAFVFLGACLVLLELGVLCSVAGSWSLGVCVVCCARLVLCAGREKASGREREALAWKRPLGRSPSGSGVSFAAAAGGWSAVWARFAGVFGSVSRPGPVARGSLGERNGGQGVRSRSALVCLVLADWRDGKRLLGLAGRPSSFVTGTRWLCAAPGGCVPVHFHPIRLRAGSG